MAITDYKITEQQIAEKGVVAAPDMLTGTAQENKGVFDRLVRETVAPAFNSVVAALADENEQRNADEATRKTQENARVAAEELRVAAENGRVAAETARETAERQRADETAGIVAQATRQAAAAEAAKTAAEDAREETIVHKNTTYRYALDAAISKNTAEASAAEAGQQAGSASGFAVRAEEALSKMGVHIGSGAPTNGAKLWLCPVNNPLVMNPDRATSDMTQEVGVNDDGKLVTTVEDGSISESKLAQDVMDKFRSLSEEIANIGGGTGTGVPGPAGAPGKSAYQCAVEGGYTGTEAEFAKKLAAEKFANPNALTFTGAVAGSYDGSAPVSVEIPSGGGGSSGFRLVRDLTLTESAESVIINSDDDGNPFSLSECFIHIFAQVTEAGKIIYIPNQHYIANTYMQSTTTTATDYAYDFSAYSVGSEEMFFGYETKTRGAAATACYNVERNKNASIYRGKITSYRIDAKFDAGARFLLYGRDA